MNVYLLKVRRWFGGYDEFTVEAVNKEEALSKGEIFVRQSTEFSLGSHNLNDVSIIRKVPNRKVGELNLPHCRDIIKV